MTIGRSWAIAIFAVLILSLGTNLLIAGFAASRFGWPPRGPQMIDRIVSIGIRAFPAQIQDDIQRRTEAQREELRTRIDAVQQARMEMLEAMRADPFDDAALEAAFADLRLRVVELQQAGQEIVGDAVANAPADERAKIRIRRGPFP
jgi:uncharacterized membrane protein